MLNIVNKGQLSNSFIAIAKVLMGVVAIFASSQVSIPFKPVPVTLQSVTYLLIGLLYSASLARVTVISYLMLGIIGVPVFAFYNAGLPYFLGPTGGYLVGMSMAAIIMSYLKERMNMTSMKGVLYLCIVGQMTIYVIGMSRLVSFVGISRVIDLGFMPFLLPSIIKTAILVLAVKAIGVERILCRK